MLRYVRCDSKKAWTATLQGANILCCRCTSSQGCTNEIDTIDEMYTVPIMVEKAKISVAASIASMDVTTVS